MCEHGKRDEAMSQANDPKIETLREYRRALETAVAAIIFGRERARDANALYIAGCVAAGAGLDTIVNEVYEIAFKHGADKVSSQITQ